MIVWIIVASKKCYFVFVVGHLKFPSKMGQKKIYEGGDRSKILFKAGVKTGFILKKRVNAMRVCPCLTNATMEVARGYPQK